MVSIRKLFMKGCVTMVKLTIRDPGSALTHFIGILMAGIGSIPLLIKAGGTMTTSTITSIIIFTISMLLLYGASTTYHSINGTASTIKLFRKIDHMMIFILIAGSYTPICVIALGKNYGLSMLITVWTIAAIGMIVNAFWINCPKWVSSVIYIAMGWVCIFVIGKLYSSLSTAAFFWLVAGGIIYTIGGVIYALKLPIFNSKYSYFGSHEVFHLFVMGGTLCHMICMYQLML